MRISGKSALHPQMPRRVEACWASSFHRYTSLGHKGGKLLHARPSSRVPIDCGRVGLGRMETFNHSAFWGIEALGYRI